MLIPQKLIDTSLPIYPTYNQPTKKIPAIKKDANSILIERFPNEMHTHSGLGCLIITPELKCDNDDD